MDSLAIRLSNFYQNISTMSINLIKQKFNNNIVDRISISQMIFFGLLLNISIGGFFTYVLFPEHSDPFDFESMNTMFYVTVIGSPWLETYLIQYLIMENFYKWFKRYSPGIITCILLFSVMHYYSIEYMFKTLFSGTVYTLIYFISMKRKWNGMFWTSIVHCLNNFIAFLITLISQNI